MANGGMSDIIMFKSQLQEYVQKASLPTPVYETTKEGPPHEPKFKSTVIVNGVSYVSPPSDFRNRKAAEHAAARVALEELGFVPNPLNERGRCKSLLQEYTQKSSLPLPIYRSEGSGKLHSPTYICTVEVSGIQYTGGAASTKKEAEMKASRVALQALEAQAHDSGSQGTVPNISPSQDVVSIVLTSPVEVPPRKRDRGLQIVSEENETVKTKQKRTASNSTPKDRMSTDINSMQVENGQGMPTVGHPQSAPVKEPEKHSQQESSQMQQDQVKVEGEVAIQAGEEGSEKLQHHEECNPLLILT